MSEFSPREHAFEGKAELDEEMLFKIDSRTARLFSIWVGEQLGLKNNDLAIYVKTAVEKSVVEVGNRGLVQRAEEVLKAANIQISHHRLIKEVDGFNQIAREQLIGQG